MEEKEDFDHLVVLSHGLQGKKEGLYYLENYLLNITNNIKILNCSSNCEDAWFKNGPFKNFINTSVGIDVAGDKVIKELNNYLEESPYDFDKISFMGSCKHFL
jgi:hypothetical protein